MSESGAVLAGASGSAADYALDKSLQLDAAARVGLPVPSTVVLDDLTGAAAIRFPVMVKSARALYEVEGTLQRPGGVICGNDDEFERAAAVSWRGPVLVQPLLQGVGEGLFGHVGSQDVTAWSSHRRVRMVNPHGSASSACRSHPVDGDLLEPSERFLSDIGWRGMFMLEFLRDADGKPWFMGLNGRAWGSMALARRRGFEYPAWTVQAALEPDFEPTPPMQPPEVLAQAEGAVAELAHPWRRNAISRYQPEWAPLLSAVEVWNRKYDGVAPHRETQEVRRPGRPGALRVIGLSHSRSILSVGHVCIACGPSIAGLAHRGDSRRSVPCGIPGSVGAALHRGTPRSDASRSRRGPARRARGSAQGLRLARQANPARPRKPGPRDLDS